jgi:RNA polymerase sigma-70 factor (ECF subfamily)
MAMLTLNRPRTGRTEDEPSDLALVARARVDVRGFEALFDRYWESVLRFCLVRLNDWHLAEDSASQAFINAYAHLNAFHGSDDSSFRCWLFAIARNTVRDTQRSMYRHPTAQLREAETLIDPTRSLEEAALESERRRQLQALLAGLSEEHRQLIELRAAGLTAAEIGVVLGKSEAAIRQAQSRLIRSLRTSVSDGPNGEGGYV